jgi:flagellin
MPQRQDIDPDPPISIQTQAEAQEALEKMRQAIIIKDQIRAHLGAMQNRLENTISNLQIQSENIQNAESRISDVDVATEMTELVQNQVLSQAAVAMLAQANSLPQMALQLITA